MALRLDAPQINAQAPDPLAHQRQRPHPISSTQSQ